MINGVKKKKFCFLWPAVRVNFRMKTTTICEILFYKNYLIIH